MMTNSKDPLLLKLPPQNIEADEALISAVLIDNSTLSERRRCRHHRGQATQRPYRQRPAVFRKGVYPF